MPKARAVPAVDTAAISPLPGWITASRSETPEDTAFRSGAALAHLHMMVAQDTVPQSLLRERLALAAAEICAGLAGRREGQAALRDALHLTRPGDHPGPAGVIARHWVRAVARPISVAHLGKTVDGLTPEQIAACLDTGPGNPVERAARVLDVLLTGNPRAETAALILADAVLSMSLGRSHLLPCLALGLKPRELRLRGDDLRLACHRAAGTGVGQAVPMAADLARRAARVQAVVPKLRAKGAAAAVELFLSHDARAPAGLAGILPDRAARRLCDRLVALGGLRELTGRDSFRLYSL